MVVPTKDFSGKLESEIDPITIIIYIGMKFDIYFLKFILKIVATQSLDRKKKLTTIGVSHYPFQYFNCFEFHNVLLILR